jgi:hypothetical protein
MSVQRLPRGTRLDPQKTGWLIAGAKKEVFEQMAANAGVTSAVFLERVIDHLKETRTDRGLPPWWPVPEPRDGELPIEAA